MPAHNRIKRTVPRPRRSMLRSSVRVRLHPRRLDASRCAGCRKKIVHPTARDWRAVGANVAIRCLDCRHAYCPRCAKRHFVPVRATRAKLMNAVVDAALKAMDITCRMRPVKRGTR